MMNVWALRLIPGFYNEHIGCVTIVLMAQWNPSSRHQANTCDDCEYSPIGFASREGSSSLFIHLHIAANIPPPSFVLRGCVMLLDEINFFRSDCLFPGTLCNGLFRQNPIVQMGSWGLERLAQITQEVCGRAGNGNHDSRVPANALTTGSSFLHGICPEHLGALKFP